MISAQLSDEVLDSFKVSRPELHCFEPMLLSVLFAVHCKIRGRDVGHCFYMTANLSVHEKGKEKEQITGVCS